MIKQPTVFVLGAGISFPYGLPLGGKLIEQIIEGLHPSNKLHLLLSQIQAPKYLATFRNALRDSGCFSIDSWLESNDQFLEIGKLSIAAVIADAENRSRKKLADESEDWIRWIWNEMLSGVREPLEILQNNVAFVTFNYDRLLEARLYRSLHASFRQATANELKNIGDYISERIIHVHGWLGKSDLKKYWDQKGPYDHVFELNAVSLDQLQGTPESIDSLQEAKSRIQQMAKGIKIIGEVTDDVFSESQKYILEAKKIVFLGFGYDERNIDRLGIKLFSEQPYEISVHDRTLPPNSIVQFKIIGSAMKLQAGERHKISERLKRKIFLGEENENAVLFSKRHLALK